MSTVASQITGVSIVCSAICSGAHQNSASLAFVQGIHQSPVNSPHKGPVMRKMFPFHNVIMETVHQWKSQDFTYDNKYIRLHDDSTFFSWTTCRVNSLLTHWGRDKMAAIFQTTFSNAFSRMKMCEFRLRFHWILFLRFELMIFQRWFR